MKNRIFLLAVLLVAFSTFAQPTKQSALQATTSNNWWKVVADETEFVEGFFERNKSILGVNAQSEFILLREETDASEMVHSRFEQFSNGVKVEGAQFILHSKNGRVIKANGRLVFDLNKSVTPSITFSQALSLAKTQLKTEFLYFENPAMETWIKEFKNDESATFYPAEELVFVDPDFSQNGEKYTLAYKIDLYYEGVKNHSTLFMDAKTGQFIFEEEGCHTNSKSAVAHTKYHGTQDIITDSVSTNKYVLNDVTRGGGIETYNLAKSTDYSTAQYFEDADNIWNNFNAQYDEAATDVHWSTARAYDYYLSVHGRDSYDNLGSKLVSYVHFDNKYFNAFWNGLYMTYGDGNGNPLTSIDVIGHELTHGVTEHSANLVYAWEPGALNESFSDIFGTHIEFNAFSDSANWLIGILDFELRSMENPNLSGQPDTYLGLGWHVQSSDNGGVHINSGVQNFWYYLLSEGGAGTNDLGNVYAVTAIGMGDAAAIAYRNLVYYLTPSSQFYDARQGSIESAADLFGECSVAAEQTAKAWYAVGVGPNGLAPDIELLTINSPIDGCGLSAPVDVSFDFTFHESGCNDSIIAAGDTLVFSYVVNGGTPVIENFVVTTPIKNKDIITFDFAQKVNLTVAGTYLFDFSITYKNDLLPENNEILAHVINSVEPFIQTDSLTFENARVLIEDPRYTFKARANSVAERNFRAKNTGLQGVLLSGANISPAIDTAANEADNFIVNPTYQSEICSCIDATNWDFITLSFDLKQTYSGFYQNIGGLNPGQFASSLRIMIGSQQIGDQYHPVTPNNDPFVKQFVDLDGFAGRQFEICFQGKHYFDKQNDIFGTDGDNSYLDNIKFEDVNWISVPELSEQDLKMWPNPATGSFVLEVNSFVSTIISVDIIDNLGRVVKEMNQPIESGFSTLPIDMSGCAAGIYAVKISLHDQTLVKKLILK